jgi:hypothetical protein
MQVLVQLPIQIRTERPSVRESASPGITGEEKRTAQALKFAPSFPAYRFIT